MKTLYLECNMGAAGDMLCACLYELLPDKAGFLEALNGLPLPGVRFQPEVRQTGGITGTHMTVTVAGHEESDHPHAHSHEHSTLPEIHHLVDRFPLPEAVLARVKHVYTRIAQAEAQVHGRPVDLVHFHEVGALDAVADITAVCYAMHLLSPDRVVVSPICTGFGYTNCAHGRLPVPAPATAILLEGASVRAGQVEGELCTPTGAALLTEFAGEYGQMPSMNLQKTGVGVGKKEFPLPNCIRAFWGEDEKREDISELVCNIDDMTPEALAFACRRILEAGALDVYTIPGVMKKGRPGHLLTVLCRPEQEREMTRTVLRETASNGLRLRRWERPFLAPEFTQVQTPWGPVRIKTAQGYGIIHKKPEYEDVARIARTENLPFQAVYDAAMALAGKL